MTKLRDLAREIVSVSEAEIEKRETSIIALRHEVERLRKELDEARDRQLAIRHPKCEGYVYRVIALRSLETEEKVKK